jgi:N-methylhydantoinase B
MSHGGYDAVSLAILWDRLVSISNEIEQTLVRTSFSTIVRENYDLACVLFDGKARCLTQGTYSQPSFIGTSQQTIRHMLAKFPPETLAPGDVLLTNDIWQGTGHMFDVNLLRPAFRKGRVVGYAMSVSHLPDIGGRGFSAYNTNMYEEGLRIPICRLVRGGQLNDELIDLIRANVRVDEQVIGDIMANVAATEVGCKRLLEFLDEYGIDDLDPLADAILDQSSRAMRGRIAAAPDGDWRNEMLVEGPEQPVNLVCNVRIRGDTLVVDYAGTDPTVPAAINVPLCYTTALTAYSVKTILLPHVPNNEGSVSPIEVSAPPGCALNALPPSATAGRHLIGHFLAPLIFGALAKALPDQVPAAPAFTNILNLSGRHRGGTPFATLYFTAGGLGGMKGLDGLSTTPSPSNMKVLSTEVVESLTNLTVIDRRLIPDSGGAGEYRGGLGAHYRLRNDTGHDAAVIGLGRRNRFPALGLLGGEPGGKRSYILNGSAVDVRARYVLAPGDVIEVRDAGGGGYGDPQARDRARVAEDVRQGFVSREAAVARYGLDPAALPEG